MSIEIDIHDGPMDDIDRYSRYSKNFPNANLLDCIKLSDHFHNPDENSIPHITMACAYNLVKQLSKKYLKIGVHCLSHKDIKTLCEMIYELQFDYETSNIDMVDTHNDMCIREIKRVKNAVMHTIQLDCETKTKIEKTLSDCRIVLENVYYRVKFTLGVREGQYIIPSNLDPKTGEPLKLHQAVLLKLCEHMNQMEYQKDQDKFLYVPVKFPVGIRDSNDPSKIIVLQRNSHFYKKEKPIENYIQEFVNINKQHDLWLKYTRDTGKLYFYQKQLSQAELDSFPYINIDRHIFTCRNGVFLCGPKHCLDKETNLLCPRFLSYGQANQEGIFNNGVSSSNFFDVDIDDETIENIERFGTDSTFKLTDLKKPTVLYKIFEDQDIPQAAITWIMVLLGRLCYDIQECDKWEVILFIKGKAGTGKSTIGKMALDMYPTACKSLSSNMNKQFGMSDLFDSNIFVCFEVGSPFNLNPQEFNSMCSGEFMQLDVKHQKSIQNKWRVPGILMGNVYMNFQDNAGDKSRRILVVEFNNPIKEIDTTLFDKLKEEHFYSIIYSVLHYASARNYCGKKDIWSTIHETTDYFETTKANMCEETNLLHRFIKESNAVRLSKGGYVLFSEFYVRFSHYCKRIRKTPPELKTEYTDSVFSMFDLKVVHQTATTYNEIKGYSLNTKIISGIVFSEEYGNLKNCHYPADDVIHQPEEKFYNSNQTNVSEFIKF